MMYTEDEGIVESYQCQKTNIKLYLVDKDGIKHPRCWHHSRPKTINAARGLGWTIEELHDDHPKEVQGT